jgi:prepilin-type N-terminal cleavage/methylation domain-containing protein
MTRTTATTTTGPVTGYVARSVTGSAGERPRTLWSVRLRRAGFTLLEVALAVGVIVSLSAAAYLSFSNSNKAINRAGENYTEGYLGELDNLLDDAGLFESEVVFADPTESLIE